MRLWLGCLAHEMSYGGKSSRKCAADILLQPCSQLAALHTQEVMHSVKSPTSPPQTPLCDRSALLGHTSHDTSLPILDTFESCASWMATATESILLGMQQHAHTCAEPSAMRLPCPCHCLLLLCHVYSLVPLSHVPDPAPSLLILEYNMG